MATIALTPGRVPPHDLDAEMSVLGSILLDPLSIAKVLQFLHPEDFYRENNGQVYRAALDLFAAGEPIDNVTVAAQLQTMGMLDRIGGRAQLASMESGQGVVGVPSGFHDLDRMTGGFKDSDLIIVAGRPSMGKCLVSHSLIDDPATGERLTIEEAVKRELPTVHGFTWNGRIKPNHISAWVDSGVKPCFQVMTRTGRSVEVTGHHPFLTVRGWQPLHDIVVGDKIAVPRRIECFGADDSWPLGQVRLVAYFVAEGSLAT